MARARNIKPGFYKNEDLAECSVWARLLFPGLWMLADRSGRLEDRPKRIKGEIFPFDTVDVDPLLDELQAWKFITRYEIDGVRYIQIVGFERHQVPHIKEKASAIPPPDGYKTPDKHSASTVQAQCKDGENTVPAPPDSLNPESLNPESGTKHTEQDSIAETPPEPDGSGCFSPGDLTKPMVESGIVRVNPGHPDMIALAQSGCTPDTVRAAVLEARQSTNSPNQSYVLSILKRWQAEPTGIHNTPRAPPRNGKQANREQYAAEARAAQERQEGQHEPVDITAECTRVA